MVPCIQFSETAASIRNASLFSLAATPASLLLRKSAVTRSILPPCTLGFVETCGRPQRPVSRSPRRSLALPPSHILYKKNVACTLPPHSLPLATHASSPCLLPPNSHWCRMPRLLTLYMDPRFLNPPPYPPSAKTRLPISRFSLIREEVSAMDFDCSLRPETYPEISSHIAARTFTFHELAATTKKTFQREIKVEEEEGMV